MDIDIDFPSEFDATKIMKQAIPASIVKGGDLVKHPCGHYLQTMPVDPHTGLAAIPHKQAQQFGFFKFDFLTLHVLSNFKTKQEIRRLIKTEPDWDILLDETQVVKLFQIKGHPDLVKQIRPTNINELADCIALIRPGKMKLIPRYLKDKQGTRKELYTQSDDDTYSYKRGHALSYAMTIVLELHLIAQGKL